MFKGFRRWWRRLFRRRKQSHMSIPQAHLDQIFAQCVIEWSIDLPTVELEWGQELFTIELESEINRIFTYSVTHQTRPGIVMVIDDSQ